MGAFQPQLPEDPDILARELEVGPACVEDGVPWGDLASHIWENTRSRAPVAFTTASLRAHLEAR